MWDKILLNSVLHLFVGLLLINDVQKEPTYVFMKSLVFVWNFQDMESYCLGIFAYNNCLMSIAINKRVAINKHVAIMLLWSLY